MNGDRFRGKASEGLSIAKVRTRNVRKTVATLIDDEDLLARSAPIGWDFPCVHDARSVHES
jgi:hypothetical protein